MKNSILVSVVLCISIVVSTSATDVQLCSESPKMVAKQSVIIERCDEPPCILKRKTTSAMEVRFTTDSKIEKLTNHVNANVFGVNLPFIGVDGVSACNQIFQADGVTPADCPLEANKDYVFKNKLDIKEIYPKLKTDVHWSLTGADGHSVMCFQVPIVIS